MKLCECGCGSPSPISKRTATDKGWIKGQPKRFINGHNTRILPGQEQARRNKSEARQAWIDNVRGTGQKSPYVKLGGRHMHRVMAERKIGRVLLPGEIVHHKDGNSRNNELDNLIVMTQSEHCKLHARKYWDNRRSINDRN